VTSGVVTSGVTFGVRFGVDGANFGKAGSAGSVAPVTFVRPVRLEERLTSVTGVGATGVVRESCALAGVVQPSIANTESVTAARAPKDFGRESMPHYVDWTRPSSNVFVPVAQRAEDEDYRPSHARR
jgi:hypothetical protein